MLTFSLPRYVLAFDKDRLALSNAYSRHATFSYRHLIPQSDNAKLCAVFDRPELTQGRRNIALMLSLDPAVTVEQSPLTLRFCSAEEPLDLQYDVVCLEQSRVLLVAHASVRHVRGRLGGLGHGMEVDEEQDGGSFSVTMNFVLRRRSDDDLYGDVVNGSDGGSSEDEYVYLLF